MKISVLIPAYNSARTIRDTLQSVLCQTVTPCEILVLDDGSEDQTSSLAETLHSPLLTVYREPRGGVAKARDALCQRARGEFLAFLDSDDIWHPRYLEAQASLVCRFPSAGAYFTGHIDFRSSGSYHWDSTPDDFLRDAELIQPLSFLRRYSQATGPFASMSYCCVPRRSVELESEPFSGIHNLQVAEDSHFLYRLALSGRSIAYTPARLAAYRVMAGSASSNRLKACDATVRVFETLDSRYKRRLDPQLRSAFREAFASKRREYAKILMGEGSSSHARVQLLNSLHNSLNPGSLARSLALLSLTYMPSSLQPKWPRSSRH